MFNLKKIAKKGMSFVLATSILAGQFIGLIDVWAYSRSAVSENAVYIIRNVATNRVMDIPNGEDKDNLMVQTWEYNGTPAQQFKFIECDETGWYYIIPQCAHTRALDCPNYSGQDGLQHQIYQQGGNSAQEYGLEDAGDGRYRIINNASGKALQDEGGVVQRSISNDDRQLWRFEQVKVDYTFSNAIKYDGADPWVIQAGGYYYLCQSMNGITISKAKNLQDLGTAKPTNVFGGTYEGNPTITSYWAPELIYLQGRWYVYFAPEENRGGNDSHRMYVLEGGTNPNDPLDGQYTLKGKIADWSADKWAIDGTVFTYNGQMYFVWSGWEGDVNVDQRIYIASMSNPWTLSSNRVAISVPTYDWEVNHSPHVNEGPEVLIKNNKVHIVYSASGSWTDDYCLATLTCSDGNFLNPSSWVKSSQPVFKKTESVYGVGHASFVKSKDGTEDWIVYHAAKYQGGGWDRNIRMQLFTWKDDYPFFGEPIAGNVIVGKPSSNNETYVDEGKYYRLQNVATGRSMDIPNAADANSLTIQTYENNDTAAQQFSFIKRDTGWYTISPKCAPTRALDNPMGSTGRNVTYQTWEQNNNIAQNFRMEKLTDGIYRIINQASLLALTDTGAEGNYTVNQQVLTNNENQQWRIIEFTEPEEETTPKTEETTTAEPEKETTPKPEETTTAKPEETSTEHEQTTSLNLGETTAVTGNGPKEVIGLLVKSESDNTINVVWGQDEERMALGQKYNVYVDNVLVLSDQICASYTLTDINRGTHSVRVTATLNGVETEGVAVEVTVAGMDLNDETTTAEVQEPPTEPEETTTEPVRQEASIEIDGYQISTFVPGHRVIYSVNDPDGEIEKVGLIYALTDRLDNESQMVIDSANDEVHSFEATEKGKLPVLMSETSCTQSYAMTMKFVNSADYYDSKISVRAYARLTSGEYVYSDVLSHSVYEIADVIYRQHKMNTPEKHKYLFDNILSLVNPFYKEEEFSYLGTLSTN